MDEGSSLVYKYVLSLDIDKFDREKDYYKEMKIGYVRYLLSFHLWGKNSAIKDDYKGILIGK